MDTLALIGRILIQSLKLIFAKPTHQKGVKSATFFVFRSVCKLVRLIGQAATCSNQIWAKWRFEKSILEHVFFRRSAYSAPIIVDFHFQTAKLLLAAGQKLHEFGTKSVETADIQQVTGSKYPWSA